MSSDTNELRPEDDVLAARLTLLSKGYEPLPVAGKRALTKGWPDDPITTERVRAECEAHPDWSNTGLRTGSLVGIDIDVVDPEQAEAVRALAEAHLGRSDMIREGSKGMMICYRNATPIRKITAGSSDRTKVEILGSRNQFVAYGVHPDTGRPYKWPNWDREPL